MAPAHGFALTGTHTLQIGFGEIGAKLDALYLTADANEVPTFSAPAKLLIQAEAMSLVSPMVLGSEPAALGGQFISPTSGANSSTPVREASVAVDVPAGTFYLWARIGGASAGSDALYLGINSSFDRVFPSPTAPYQWVRVETTDGSGIHNFALAAGTHIIQVGHGEINARLDAVYLTSDANETPAFAPMRRVIEAESFTLQSPMTVGTDANASGAQFISPSSGTNSTTPIREAFTTVTAPASGTYYLWARIGGPSSTADALYVGFDSVFTRVFPVNAVPYDWVRVEAAPGIPGFSLTAGPHDIQVGHGEIGARLDAVYVTDDANDSPPGSTPGNGFPATCALPNGGYEGFGRNTTGGTGQPMVHVTNLNDSGPGSLREALSAGNRCIVFDVGGTINATTFLSVRSNVTIDGFTAPSPGITVRNVSGADQPAFSIYGGEPNAGCTNSAVGNVVVRGIRIRQALDDGITVYNATRVVVDRVSVSGIGDGSVDVTQCSRDVTIRWSIFGGVPRANLITFNTARVSIHHNLYVNSEIRNPHCGAGGATPSDLVCDVGNNLIWNYKQGTEIRTNATVNVINNYYNNTSSSPWVTNDSETIKRPATEGGVAYVSGNHSENGFAINDNGNRSTPFPIDPQFAVTYTDARTAAVAVRSGAGARGPNFGLDPTDQAFVNGISIP